MTHLQTLVVVGNGMASHRLCERLVAAGAHRALRVVIFGDEQAAAYDRVHLGRLLAGGTLDELTLRPACWYADHGLELHLGDPIVSIDREAGIVRSAAGLIVEFDRLVLACGSHPHLPTLVGIESPGVFVYRTARDAEAIRASAVAGGVAVVLGGGLLGLEAARAAHDLGLTVHLLQSGPHLLSRQLDAPAAEVLRHLVEKIGVRVYTGTIAKAIEGSFPRLAVQLGGQRTLLADLVIVAAGVRPRGELAAACGLATTPAGAVIVDDHMQTSDPSIYAVGECAAYRGATHALAAPTFDMVDTLVDGLLGGDARFTPVEPAVKLKVLGAAVAVCGPPSGGRDRGAGAAITRVTATYTETGVYRGLVLEDGRLAGFASVGEWDETDELAELVATRRRLSVFELRRFRASGRLWAHAPTTPVRSWPDPTVVCTCLKVTRGMLGEWMRAGCASPEALSRASGAGTMCGSCKPLLVELAGSAGARVMPAMAASTYAGGPVPIPVARPVAFPAPMVVPLPPLERPRLAALASGSIDRPRARAFHAVQVEPALRARITGSGRFSAVGAGRSPSLAGASVLTVALLAVFVFLGAGPWRAPLQRAFFEWTDGWHAAYSVFSGLAASALIAAGLVLSLRKRWRRLRSSSFDRWRTFHGAVNVVGLLALGLHTRFASGGTMSTWLVLAMSAVMLTGVVAGWFFSGAQPLRPKTAHRTKRLVALVHLVVTTPLLALLVAHMLASLYFVGWP